MSRRRTWDHLIVALVLIRLGQELGQGGTAAVAVRDFLDCLLRLIR